ncbi:hypothetical protein ACRALDRAFT_1075866 [Sodiomyces alcalophilus JCM 7366]|uniref:uncharacterized protein n=1 Tax=Sodiomyces alcalophilus JCM 7366 TaxID=591952 RepID=UPI0039B5C656
MLFYVDISLIEAMYTLSCTSYLDKVRSRFVNTGKPGLRGDQACTRPAWLNAGWFSVNQNVPVSCVPGVALGSYRGCGGNPLNLCTFVKRKEQATVGSCTVFS